MKLRDVNFQWNSPEEIDVTYSHNINCWGEKNDTAAVELKNSQMEVYTTFTRDRNWNNCKQYKWELQ